MKRVNSHLGKRWQLLIVALCIPLIIAGGSVFLLARTANGQSGSTAAQHSLATATSPLTPTITPSIRKPLFTDFFFDNSKDWLVGDTNGYTRVISQGQLILSDTNHKELIESIPPGGTAGLNDYTDFLLITTFTLTQADKNDSVGLYLRGDSNLDHDYRISISSNTSYKISKQSLDKQNKVKETELVKPTTTSLMRPVGQRNTLTATMKGSTLVLKLNGSVITSLNDSDYTHGQIALFVKHGPTSSGVTASFSSIEIYPVPDDFSG